MIVRIKIVDIKIKMFKIPIPYNTVIRIRFELE